MFGFRDRRETLNDIPLDAPPEIMRTVLRATIEDRLRDVCGNWTTGEFDRVVADVTATAMKFHTPTENRQVVISSDTDGLADQADGDTSGRLRPDMD